MGRGTAGARSVAHLDDTALDGALGRHRRARRRASRRRLQVVAPLRERLERACSSRAATTSRRPACSGRPTGSGRPSGSTSSPRRSGRSRQRRGLLGRPRRRPVRWVVDHGDARRPTARRTLAGAGPAGEAFPTGHEHAPAHVGLPMPLVTDRWLASRRRCGSRPNASLASSRRRSVGWRTAAASSSSRSVVLVLILFLSARGIAGFYTDYLWFDSLGFARRLHRGARRQDRPRRVIFTASFFVLAVRQPRRSPTGSRRGIRPPGPEDELLERYQRVVGPPGRGRCASACRCCFGLIAGVRLSQPVEGVDPLHATAASFGIKDPQFGRTSASTSSSCRSSRSSSTGCSPRS